jgi:hypothetical protein
MIGLEGWSKSSEFSADRDTTVTVGSAFRTCLVVFDIAFDFDDNKIVIWIRSAFIRIGIRRDRWRRTLLGRCRGTLGCWRSRLCRTCRARARRGPRSTFCTVCRLWRRGSPAGGCRGLIHDLSFACSAISRPLFQRSDKDVRLICSLATFIFSTWSFDTRPLFPENRSLMEEMELKRLLSPPKRPLQVVFWTCVTAAIMSACLHLSCSSKCTDYDVVYAKPETLYPWPPDYQGYRTNSPGAQTTPAHPC